MNDMVCMGYNLQFIENGFWINRQAARSVIVMNSI